MNGISMKILFIFILLLNQLLIYGQDISKMPDSQKKALEERKSTSVSIDSFIKKNNSDKILIEDSKISISASTKTNYEIPNKYKYETVIINESNNKIIIVNPFLSDEYDNVLIFEKGGSLISSFGRKGKGPAELINYPSEIKIYNDSVYYPVSGGLKVSTLSNPKKESSVFFGVWLNSIIKEGTEYYFTATYSEVFNFPIYGYKNDFKKPFLTISEERVNIYNNNSVPYWLEKTNNFLIFGGSTFNEIIKYDLTKKEISKRYELFGKSIRNNGYGTKSEASNSKMQIDKYLDLLGNVFQVNKTSVCNNKLFLLVYNTVNKITKFDLIIISTVEGNISKTGIIIDIKDSVGSFYDKYWLPVLTESYLLLYRYYDNESRVEIHAFNLSDF